MAGLLSGWWTAIWPNLAANVLWVPLAWLHHVMMRRQAERQAERHKDELQAHVTAALAATARKET